MRVWIHRWLLNGWRTSGGYQVANRDLIQEAYDLDCELRELGHVEYNWVPRRQNEDANRYCNEELDNMEEDN